MKAAIAGRGPLHSCERGSRRRRLAPFGWIVLVLLCSLASFAAPAQAARVHSLLLSETLPEGQEPYKVAVNQTTHHFYLVAFTSVAPLEPHLYNFEENGSIDAGDPELTGAPNLNPREIAVDNSGAPSNGSIYVSGGVGGDGVVQQFDSSGQATAVAITESAIPSNGSAQGGGLPPVVNTGIFDPKSLVVDDSGNLFVVDVQAKAIDVFTSAGTFVAQLAAGGLPEGTRAIATDAFGHIYVARDANQEGLGEGLFELDAATGQCVQVGCAPIDPAPITGVAVDNAREQIFTTARGGGKFSEYDLATGDLLGVTQSSHLHSPQGIAVDEATGEVIIPDTRPLGEGTIQLYGEVEVVPDVVTLSPQGVTDESVILKGEIGAAGVPEASCSFQYVSAEEFEAHGFESAAEAPCAPVGPFSGTTMESVHADLEGLRGGTEYHERLVGRNENGSNPGEDIPFTTLGPSVAGTEAIEVGQTAATVKGFVDPNGTATTYRFQYLTLAQFEAGGWATASEVPAGGEAIGAGTEPVPVSAKLEGLTPATAYRIRIVAVSTGGAGAGETRGEEEMFATYATAVGGLPDGRVYEQVSPVDKNGVNAEGEFNAVEASPEGNRITFFSNTGIPGGEGGQQYPTYLASRGDGSGWSTQGLLPPAVYGPRAFVLGWSQDLEDVYDFASQPFQGGRLLRRGSASRSLTQIGTIEAKTNPFAFAGSARDGSVALLESKEGGLLPGDLDGKQNVYAYDRETGKLVVAGVLDDGTTVPAGGAMAGPYDWYGGLGTSGGGAFTRYFTQNSNAISADGKRVFFTAGQTGQLYVRVNPLAESRELGAEECLEEANANACTVRISAPEEGVTDPGTPAAFLGASADGTVVYFLDKGKLTGDATGGSGYDLYRYDLETRAITDLTLDSVDKRGARVEGMLGISNSGEDAYFVAAGGLAEGASQAPLGETNLYSLEGAEIHLIARLGTAENEEEEYNWIPRARTGGNRTVTHTARVSPDGRTLLLRSKRPLTAYRSHGVAELYLYRRGAGISCISCNPTGEAPAGPSGVQEISGPGFGLPRTYAFMTHNLSPDGQRVIFDSADRLLAADENEVNDVYEWEAKGKGSCDREAVAGGCLFLISSGAKDAGPSYFGDADENGENAFFFTAQQLVAQDKDELIDIYDARVGGGIAAQNEVPPVSCPGEEGCLEAPPPLPVSSAPRSPNANGTNVTPAPRCKKGFVRRHGKCVRKARRMKSRKAHHHKRHNHKRGKGKRPHGGGKGGRS